MKLAVSEPCRLPEVIVGNRRRAGRAVVDLGVGHGRDRECLGRDHAGGYRHERVGVVVAAVAVVDRPARRQRHARAHVLVL